MSVLSGPAGVPALSHVGGEEYGVGLTPSAQTASTSKGRDFAEKLTNYDYCKDLLPERGDKSL